MPDGRNGVWAGWIIPASRRLQGGEDMTDTNSTELGCAATPWALPQ